MSEGLIAPYSIVSSCSHSRSCSDDNAQRIARLVAQSSVLEITPTVADSLAAVSTAHGGASGSTTADCLAADSLVAVTMVHAG